MEWFECKIITTNEGVEAVSAMLMDVGINGVQIEDDKDMINFLNNNPGQWDYIDEELMNRKNENVIVTFYVSFNQFGREQLLAVKDGISRISSIETCINLGTLSLTTQNVKDEDWIDNWKKYYKPFSIGEKVIVKPLWEQYPEEEGKIIFNINPGHVFGTGLHQTTQMCICQLEKHVNKNSTVLDLGCGSGILSVIALMFGAKNAFAVDIDPNAVDIAYENAKLNNIDIHKYTVVSGNVLNDEALRNDICKNKCSIVTANIVADVIISLATFVPLCIENGGFFISSGIIQERVEEVKAALLNAGFFIVEIVQKDDWYCILSTFK